MAFGMSTRTTIIAGVGLLVVVAAAAWFFLFEEDLPPPPPPAKVAAKPAPKPAAKPAAEAPKPAAAPQAEAPKPAAAAPAADKPVAEAAKPAAPAPEKPVVVASAAPAEKPAAKPAPKPAAEPKAAAEAPAAAPAPAAAAPTEPPGYRRPDNITELYTRYNDLISAVVMRDRFGVAELLDDGKNPNARQSDGQTALMIAVAQGDVDIVRLLLEKGADPNLGNAGRNPLSLALDRRDTATADLLRSRGAR